MKARHLRPTPRAVRLGRALTVPMVALAALSATAPAMAAKPSGGSSSGTASCSANPSTPTVGTSYQVVARGLAAGTVVDVLVSDGVGTTSLVATADSSGVAVVYPYASFSGNTTATVNKHRKNGFSYVTSCSYTIS